MRRPEGEITRGTTAPNRLRRVDRWIADVHGHRLRSAARPLVVDLGYGASPITTVELHTRLRAVHSGIEVVGLEIDPARVAAARAAARPGLSFAPGGFELPVDRAPVLVRAFNVLRQYDEAAAWRAWAGLCGRLAPDGALVEGTCDEIGRRACWVTLGPEGPRTITFAAHLASLARPSDLAERLPKTLIHRNVPGERVHALLAALDRCWATAAPHSVFGARARWIETVALLAADHPVRTPRRRRRLGELTLPWSAVAP
ncbi:class I SAM-dependent methyltransferase [Actinomadura craniellae]|uniref:Class I SAM-dependent methyltransferase n=1 Tax=Actinomadura craniellae TaxID=2231787 RepID=A0A365GX45_9ACTN|nr:class I SAM-dependent methyltransferase [Actinomadura craniellae]RAY11362.1 class I SAM-dependent methyltransferase [Actinomadura craniellae]